MKVLTCQPEDLPKHLAEIENYTLLNKVDLVKTKIRDMMIELTKAAYVPNSNIIATKLVDDSDNALSYTCFYYGQTIPVVISKGAIITEYGRKRYTATELINKETLAMYFSHVIRENTKEVLVYQRKSRSRFSNKILINFTEPGQPLQGWKLRVIADIPPYGVVNDKLLAHWVVGPFNGIAPERMTITQLTKIA